MEQIKSLASVFYIFDIYGAFCPLARVCEVQSTRKVNDVHALLLPFLKYSCVGTLAPALSETTLRYRLGHRNRLGGGLAAFKLV